MKRIAIFMRDDNEKAIVWLPKIKEIIEKSKTHEIVEKNPDIVIALGGDGSILEATKKFMYCLPVFIGFNLGTVGFLASVRGEEDFLRRIEDILNGNFRVHERMMLDTKVVRNNKIEFQTVSMNDVSVHNLLGMCELEVKINEYPIQYVRGSGVLVSSATGSTAYNLSAHGPIVMPTLKCMIINELLDHNIPTPSIIVDHEEEIIIKVLNFRKHGIFKLTSSDEKIDCIVSSDGKDIHPLELNDEIIIKKADVAIKFGEFEKDYFLKSLQEKFSFK